MGILSWLRSRYHAYSNAERRNIALWILGTVIYKIGIETFNGSMIALATNRYDFDASRNNTKKDTFFIVGLMTGFNTAAQCIGANTIAPLIRRYSIKIVLAVSMSIFALCSTTLLVVDALTGGNFIPTPYQHSKDSDSRDDFSYYGSYPPYLIVVVYVTIGFAYGMKEIIRRTIPRDIVGGDVLKLRELESMVHTFAQIMGIGASWLNALVLIPRFGNNRSFIVSPICFSLATIIWLFLRVNPKALPEEALERPRRHFLNAVGHIFMLWFESVYTGAKIVCTNRKFIWLVPAYSLTLYGHRFLEHSITPAVARRYLGEAAWAQVMNGGGNVGEVLASLTVFLVSNRVQTPLPWLRLDALMLLIVWYLPYWRPEPGQIREAWIAAATLIPVSYGWAAGDVSLTAYIQASLADLQSGNQDIESLPSVMSFVWCISVAMMAIMKPLMGRYVDQVYNNTGEDNIYEAIRNIGGVQFTVLAVVIAVATLVPSGSWAINPKILNGQNMHGSNIVDEEAAASGHLPYEPKNGSIETKRSIGDDVTPIDSSLQQKDQLRG